MTPTCSTPMSSAASGNDARTTPERATRGRRQLHRTGGERQKGTFVAAHLIAERPTTTRRRDDRSVAVTTTDGTSWTWQDLVREFEPALSAYARSRGIRQPDDVVQDVLVTAVRKLDDFEGDRDNLRSWLFMLTYRAHRRPPSPVLSLAPGPGPRPRPIAGRRRGDRPRPAPLRGRERRHGGLRHPLRPATRRPGDADLRGALARRGRRRAGPVAGQTSGSSSHARSAASVATSRTGRTPATGPQPA